MVKNNYCSLCKTTKCNCKSIDTSTGSGTFANTNLRKSPNISKLGYSSETCLTNINTYERFKIDRQETPNFVLRFHDNHRRVDKRYFSVIGELFIRVYGAFESVGYRIPNKAFDGREIRPDISVGILFSKYLKTNHPKSADDFKMYNYLFSNKLEIPVRQYKNTLLPFFIDFVNEDWLPKHAYRYFKERDPLALDYLPKLIGR